MSELAKRRCVPCRASEGARKLSAEEAAALHREVPSWTLAGERLSRTFRLPGFREAIAFVGRVAELAEAEDHHPDILVKYRDVTLTLWTHDVGGLHENDFVLAAKVDALG